MPDQFDEIDKIIGPSKKVPPSASSLPGKSQERPISQPGGEFGDIDKIIGAPTPVKQTTADEEELGPFGSVARGFAKEAAGMMTGAANLAGKGMNLAASALPEEYGQRVNKFVEEDLGSPQFQSIQRFANEPGRNWWETGGTSLGMLAGLAAGPGGLQLGTKAATAAPRAISKFIPQFAYSRAAGVAPNPAFERAAGAVAPWAERAGKAAETIGRGAYGGFVTNPLNPIAGAIGGSLGGGLSALAAKGLHNTVGQGIATYLGGPTLAYEIAHRLEDMGVPREAAYAITFGALGGHYTNTPLGRATRKGMRTVFEKAGSAIERAGPKAGGAVGGAASQVLGPEEEQARPTVTVPRRAQ